MWYFISLMIKEDIPYLKLTNSLQVMVQTLNETAIYHKILTQHEMAPNTFYKWLNIPLKINVPCMEMMKTCCSEVNLNLYRLSNCNFLNGFFFLLILFIILAKNWYKTKKNKRNCFNFVLYYQIIRIIYFCVKNWKRTILLHFMEVLYQKDWKVAKMWKNMHFVLWLPWQRDNVMILIMISYNLQ